MRTGETGLAATTLPRSQGVKHKANGAARKRNGAVDPVQWSEDRQVSVITLPDGGSFVRFHGKARREVLAECKRLKITPHALLLKIIRDSLVTRN